MSATARCRSSRRSRRPFASAARRAPADALCVAQPTISGHLRKLGDSLGVRLFDLRGKRLVPTAAALALVEASDEVSAALERCERTLCAYRRERAVAANDGRA
jgi:DNA-binding transcriptional LysR family regulator